VIAAVVTAVAATDITTAAVVIAVATGIITAAEDTDTRMIQKCSRLKT